MKNVEGLYPLTPQQQGILNHALREQASSMHSEIVTWVIEGEVDIPTYVQAWQRVVDRHTALRTFFVWEGLDEPLQVVRARVNLTLAVEDWRALAAEERQARLEQYLSRERERSFNLSVAPLMRLSLLRIADDLSRLVWSHPGLLVDRRSASIVFDEVLEFYESLSAGTEPRPEPARPFSDFVVWGRRQDFSRAEAHWRQALRGLDADAAPLTPARPDGATTAYAVERTPLSSEAAAAVELLARSHGLSPETIYQGAWAVLLSRYRDSRDVIFGVEVEGRPPRLPGAESMVGMLADALPVRVGVEPRTPLVPWLKRIEEQRWEAVRAVYAPLSRIREWADAPEGGGLFDSVIAFEGREQAPTARAGLAEFVRRSAAPGGALSVSVRFGGEPLLRLIYDAGRFDDTTARRMLGHFRQLLESIAANPAASPDKLEMLTPDERRQLLVEWGEARTEYPRDRCIHELFEAEVERAPGAVAVSFGERELTYAELNRRANQLANHLRAMGVGAEIPVGLCVERSVEMVVGLLGILKAGGTYIPLDPNYPAELLTFMFEDSAVPVLLTQEAVLDELPMHTGHVVCLDADWDEIALASDENPANETTADNLAYVIYTSGSTGRPKGACVTHRGVVRLVKETNYATFGPGEIFLQLAPVSFDASTFEIWGALLNGARLVVMLPGAASLEELGEAVTVYGVTTLWLTAGLFHLMADTQLDSLLGVRQLLAGGDVLSPQHVNRVLAAPGALTLVNGYGPTENTTFTCCHRMPSGSSVGTNVPIGTPISNTEVFILDRELRPAPVGVPGELYVGGDGLARGYHNRPGLTAERFVPHPFSREPGARLYRTLDRARRLEGGEVEFLGRFDRQVKVRGYRVEPGEIEVVLAAHHAVREVLVEACEDSLGDKRLVTYLVAGPGAEVSADELRAHLRRKLPEYMMPAAFVTLECMPLTANGKVDRRALPEPDGARPEWGEAYVGPRDETEEALAAIWAEVLRIERVGVHDNFFESGGHSLLATQVVVRMREVFGADVPLRLMFEQPTVAQLAASVGAGRCDGGAQPLPEIVPVPRDQKLPLSFAQQRLWFVQQLEPESAAYNIASAVRLKGPLNVTALEQTFNEIVRRHEALCTSFVEADGRPSQVIAPRLVLKIPVVELSGLSELERESVARQLVEEEARRPFRLCDAPLLRVKLLRVGGDEHIAVLTMHHIISDGWSMGVLVKEVAALYEAFSAGQPSPLPELPIQYADFAYWQRQSLEGELLETHLAYWREQLSDSPAVLRLPADRSRPAVATSRSANQPFTLPGDLSDALNALSRGEDVTLFMTLLAAFKTLLYRYTGQLDIVLGTNVANRLSAQTEGLIGFFVNMLVLRTDLSGNPTFRELLGRVREMTLEAFAHQDVPFDKLVQELRPERDTGRTLLFQTVFSLQNATHEVLRLSGLTLAPVEVSSGEAKYDIVLNMWEMEQGLSGTLQYNVDLFEAATVSRLLRHFETLLRSIVAAPGTNLSALAMLSPEENMLFEKATRIDELNASFSL
jgi:amino acid adenylation domain-containing protein